VAAAAFSQVVAHGSGLSREISRIDAQAAMGD
jgi:hypothetical protein